MKTSRRIVVATAAVAAFASGAGIAFAAWSTTIGGSGTSQAVSVTAPGAPTANGSSTATAIPIQWTAGSVGGATVSYWVQRADFNGSTYSDACSSTQAAPITGTSCTDTGLASSHDYQYKVTVIAGNWQKSGGVSGKLSTAASANLAITSVAPGSNKASFGGTGGANGATITVYVCSAGTCGSSNNTTSATATVSGGTWTTGLTGTNVNSGATLRAVAYQTSPSNAAVTSAVFTFHCSGSGSSETCASP